MSATLSGLMALENPTPLEDSSSTVFFDGQMWLGPQQILTSIFHYYNLSNIAFANIRQYFLWIHVAKFDMTLNTQDGKHSSSHEDETYDQSKEQLKDDVTQSDGSSQTLQHNDDIIHIVGDIIHLIPTNVHDIRERAYINISSAAINSNKTGGFFKVNAPQYTSHFKHNHALSILPVHANFNSNKYKTKKPIPANNTYVSIKGFLESIETDSTGHTTSFHVSVDNINFLGRATVSPSAPANTALTTPSRSSHFKFDFNITSPGSSTEATLPEPPSASPLSEIGILTRGGKRKR